MAKLEALAGELEADALEFAFRAADIRHAEALSAVIAALADELGPVEVRILAAAGARVHEADPRDHVEDVRGPLEFSVLGAVAAATTVIGPMLERGSGTILFTTGGAAINSHPLGARMGISFAGEVRDQGAGRARRPRDRQPDRPGSRPRFTCANRAS
jgi:NADP-dependent 3-hydroxy acid dehydrogenase YdfG